MHHTLSQLRERYLLLTLAGMQFSHILDFMIMMPLGPILMREFAIGTHEFGFLVASYSFSAALAGLLAATFVDRFERKRLLLIVFGLFGLATLACALAPSYTTLLVARGLAGAFGGVVGAMVQTLVGDLIPFERRATASGIISTSFSLATVAGVPVSLWLANQFQWRAPFLFIAASTVLFILIAQRFLPDVRHHLTLKKRTHPFAAMFEVLRDRNHLRALLFTLLI
ncbi:MAG TPA: MFS transporter, partial [Gallionella sp.]|nr:MFS transporter [Gallionella sp.]